MATGFTFSQWLKEAGLDQKKLTQQKKDVLLAAYEVLQDQEDYYASQRLAEYLLLRSQCPFKKTHIAALIGWSRKTVARHQGLSIQQMLDQIQQRRRGNAHGKLLPQHLGPIVQFLFYHPQATRQQLLDFIQQTWGFQVSRTALWKYFHKFGLDPGNLDPPETCGQAQSPSHDREPSSQHEDSLCTDDNPSSPPSSSEYSGSPPAGSPPAGSPPAGSPPAARVVQASCVPPYFGPTLGPQVEARQVQYLGRTQYAGAFLLWPEVMRWLDVAEDCFSDENGWLQRGFLTSAWGLIIGLERMYHLDQMQDQGFALMTGNWRCCPSRYTVGAWRRQVAWREADRFCHQTSPYEELRDQAVTMSFDEHTIPRWTKKFHIAKGHVTTRNKRMRCEKLFLGYSVDHQYFINILATRGNVELREVASQMTRQALHFGQPLSMHALFDAGAAKADANVRELIDLAASTPNLEVTMRACRQPARLQRWKSLPADEFQWYEEEGHYRGGPPKLMAVAETVTPLRDETPDQAVRTIVCRQEIRGPKKDRWHPLFTSHRENTMEAGEVVDAFRQRQHQEQAFRVEVHDEFINAIPCAYDKTSPDPIRPRFQRGGFQLVGWLAALVYNLCVTFASGLSARYHPCFIRTLRRTFFNREGTIWYTPTTLIVQLDWFREQTELDATIRAFNAAEHRLAGFGNRKLIISLSLHPARAGP